ncbi:MAG: hypothetical protein H6R07_1100 [Proteobacteria bacterium]|nr:hypothetical protein [Pseudomonadota bacterium]
MFRKHTDGMHTGVGRHGTQTKKVIRPAGRNACCEYAVRVRTGQRRANPPLHRSPQWSYQLSRQALYLGGIQRNAVGRSCAPCHSATLPSVISPSYRIQAGTCTRPGVLPTPLVQPIRIAAIPQLSWAMEFWPGILLLMGVAGEVWCCSLNRAKRNPGLGPMISSGGYWYEFR